MFLNKNGWGLKIAILFCCIFMFCLLLAVFLATRAANQLDEVHEEQGYGEDENYDVTEYYNNLETDIYEAVKEYADDNPKILEKDYFKLNIDTLIEDGYVTSFLDEYGNQCSGYIEIYNDSQTSYSVYIKCEDYETIGYDERKAF